MEIHVTIKAIECLKEEWGFKEGELVRVYIRYVSGGKEPYALGIQKDRPVNDVIRTVAGGITFFIEEYDQWFIQGRNISIDAQGIDILFELQ